MSSEPRASTEDESASLLQIPGQNDEEGGAEHNGGGSTSGRRSRRSFLSDVDDRRSIKDVIMNPRLLTTLEQGLVIVAICLICLSGILAGLFLGSFERLRREAREREREPPVIRTTTQTDSYTITQTQTTTVASSPTVPTSSSVPLPPKEPPSKNDQICLTPTCVQISAAILDSIDESVDPCDDFYHFANGGWLAAHPIPAEKGLFGSAQWIDQRNKDTLKRILEQPIEDVVSSLHDTDDLVKQADRDNLKSLNVFYSSCMDEDALDRKGSKPLVDIVKEAVKAWQAPNKKDQPASESRKQRLTDTLLFLHSRGIDALFGSTVQGDYVQDPNAMRLWLSQSGLGLPNPEYYDDTTVEKIYEEVIRSSVSSLLTQLNAEDEDIHSESGKKKKKGKKGSKDKKKPKRPVPEVRYKEVFNFERKLAKVFVDSVELEDPVAAYSAYDLEGLHKIAPYIQWGEYFSGFAPRVIPSPTIIATPSYFSKLTAILKATDDETLEQYFIWTTIKSLSSLLGPRETARKEVTQLANYLSGIEEGVRGRREDVCLQSLLDNYGFMMGRYFIKQAFTGDSKVYAETLIKSAVQAFKDRLPELDWLDDVSRKAAEDKASAIGIKIGYATSPNVTDPLALKNYYAASAPIKGHFFESVLQSRIMDERRKWFTIGKQRDRGMWDMIPTEVNAYYEPSANEMAFPAGVLQAPYFSKDYPEFLGFGSMASLAGHELTHAFDSAGRQFDKTGKLTDWWTNDTIARYEKLTECIVDQYAKYYVVGPDGKKYHVNSKVTLGEDIADGGGLAQTFRAWQDRFASDPKGEKFYNYILPGLNYTREQLFYIQFARGWARNIKPAESVRRIRVDEHSPTNFRVIGPLSNSEEFSKAFKCPVGSRMNPKHKCHIW